MFSGVKLRVCSTRAKSAAPAQDRAPSEPRGPRLSAAGQDHAALPWGMYLFPAREVTGVHGHALYTPFRASRPVLIHHF